jgi:hypothetical protein
MIISPTKEKEVIPEKGFPTISPEGSDYKL